MFSHDGAEQSTARRGICVEHNTRFRTAGPRRKSRDCSVGRVLGNSTLGLQDRRLFVSGFATLAVTAAWGPGHPRKGREIHLLSSPPRLAQLQLRAALAKAQCRGTDERERVAALRRSQERFRITGTLRA